MANDSKELERISREVYKQCNVYPRPDEDTVKKEIKRVRKVMSCEKSMEPSSRRVARKVSKALDLKTRINENGWIKYDGETRDIVR